jgi:hypothetical protein
MNAPQPDQNAIQTHIESLHQVAKGTGIAGKLVLASFGQDPQTGVDLTAKCRTFAIGDVDGMVKQTLVWTMEPHRNVYASLVVMRLDLADGKKGEEADILSVLGLVADFDDAQASQWPPRIPMQPTVVLETSENRFQA